MSGNAVGVRRGGLAAWDVLLLPVAAVVHALVLAFWFPGYYRPLWPHHSDFYIPAALAQSGFGLADYVRLPRPAAAMFLGAIGHLGIRGSMAAVLAVIFLNLVLVAALLRRVLRLRLSVAFASAFAGYSALVFAHPFFYVFATYDSVSQLSLLLLLLAAACWMRAQGERSGIGWWLGAAALCQLAFLAKETYGPGAIVLAVAWGAWHWRRDWRRALAPSVTLAATLALALAINRLNASPFTGSADTATSPYHIVLAPASLVSEWTRYARDGLSAPTLVVLFLVVAATLLAPDRRWRWTVIPLAVAGMLAWLPNAALPNHHDAGYAWGATPLLFAPVLLVPFALAAIVPHGFAWAAAPLVLLGTVAGGHAPGSDWVLQQEARQRKLLQSLKPMIARIAHERGGSRILVSGIDFPFSPFDHGLALRSMGAPHGTQFDVVQYQPRGPGIPAFPSLDAVPSGVRFVPAPLVDLAGSSEVWAFRSDGSLVRRAAESEYRAVEQTTGQAIGANPLVYPALLDAFAGAAAAGSREEGFRMLSCGSALLAYGNASAAEGCLLKSAALIPDNPYPWFYLGRLRENEGQFAAAREFYWRAVGADQRDAPNPAFRDAVERVGRAASANP